MKINAIITTIVHVVGKEKAHELIDAFIATLTFGELGVLNRRLDHEEPS